MPGPDASLPQDVDLLHALVRELQEREARHLDRIKQLRHERYGRKSEKGRKPQPTPPGKPHGKGGRHRLPAHLRTRTVVVNPSKSATKGMVIIHREVREYLEYEPASMLRVEQIFPVWGDPKKKRPPCKARVPTRVIAQAAVGPGLLARMLVAKYGDHLPLARQCTIFARDGANLTRQKLCRWVGECALLLRRIHDLLALKLHAADYFQGDETPVPVRERGRRGKTSPGYFWVYLAPRENVVVFDFQMTRHRRAAQQFVPRRRVGVMQTDGYTAYCQVAESRPMMLHLGCNGHARRKVKEAELHGERHAAVVEALADYAGLYEIEKRTRQLADDERAKIRGAECPAIFERLRRRYEEALVQKPAKRRFRLAAKYSLERWRELTRYAAPGFGHVHIDTNAVERAIRPVKLGIRNYLFIGCAEAGWRSAVLYTILGTCKLLHVNAEAYLRWVLPKLAGGTNESTAVGLLPHDYAAILAARRKEQKS